MQVGWTYLINTLEAYREQINKTASIIITYILY